MNRHFIPKPYREKERQYEENLATKKTQWTPEPPYKVKWWRKTRLQEKTDMFYISFTVENDPQFVYDSLVGQFGENVAIVSNWMYWYEVLLKEKLTWDEIKSRVDVAFMGKLP